MSRRAYRRTTGDADVAPGREHEALLGCGDGRELSLDRAVSLGTHAAVQDNQVSRNAFEAGREVLEVILSLGQQDGRAAIFQRPDHIIQDQLVPVTVPGQRGIDLLNAGPLLGARHPERGLSHEQPVLERATSRLRLGVDREADRAELHLDDRMMTITPLRRGRQPDDVPGLDLRENALEVFKIPT